MMRAMKPVPITDVQWMSRSLCRTQPTEWWTETDLVRGPNVWRSEENQAAVSICQACPAINDCLEYVLTIERSSGSTWGIYASLRPDQRNALYSNRLVS